MAWKSIPNFNDENAKISERMHISGARIIEVLYGGRNADGAPVAPADRDADGHGCWLALELDGVYQMLSWQHPAQEGGGLEYGRSGSTDPLADLERDIVAKETICRQADALAESQDWKNAPDRFSQLFDQWKQLYNWGTPRENELWNQFQAAKQAFFDRRDKNREENKAAKQGLIEEAKALAGSTEWSKAGDRFQALFEQWKALGSAGRSEDNALWGEFNAPRQEFFQRRSQHYAEMAEAQAKSREEKQAIIAEARQAAEGSTQWKATGDKLTELMTKWKAAGYAGRDDDDRLWQEFNGIRQDFFTRRHEFYDEQERQYQAVAHVKEGLIQEAAELAARCDYSAEVTGRMKALDQAWKDAGSAGRERENRLWDEFRTAKEGFWTARRAYVEEKQREWRARLVESIARKKEQVSHLEQQICELQYKMIGMKNEEYLENMRRWIEEKEARIQILQTDIGDMEGKL